MEIENRTNGFEYTERNNVKSANGFYADHALEAEQNEGIGSFLTKAPPLVVKPCCITACSCKHSSSVPVPGSLLLGFDVFKLSYSL
ncbi:hypothetical protein COCON_G00157950 [Conger conger]|uniref:Uncharacterized protein n=1 Tax=Conger conger TaxID=82655 RepID=A0A9Q1D9I6_CONCO|nr:hypothetical protein COCON_G00157950 [Conger conger]